MRFWPKLIFLLVLIALLAFAGARLFGMVMGFWKMFPPAARSRMTRSSPSSEPTPTPRVFTDQDYDSVQGVREE